MKRAVNKAIGMQSKDARAKRRLAIIGQALERSDTSRHALDYDRAQRKLEKLEDLKRRIKCLQKDRAFDHKLLETLQNESPLHDAGPSGTVSGSSTLVSPKALDERIHDLLKPRRLSINPPKIDPKLLDERIQDILKSRRSSINSSKSSSKELDQRIIDLLNKRGVSVTHSGISPTDLDQRITEILDTRNRTSRRIDLFSPMEIALLKEVKHLRRSLREREADPQGGRTVNNGMSNSSQETRQWTGATSHAHPTNPPTTEPVVNYIDLGMNQGHRSAGSIRMMHLRRTLYSRSSN